MAVSRRTFLGSALAASAVVAWPGKGFARAAGSPPGDVVGKVTVGYQGWFACPGDGAPINGWWHWSNDWSKPPSPANKSLIAWPDMSEYTATYQTAFGPLGSGAPATLFSSYDQQTVDTHFRWMRENDCDTAALQRFNPFGGEGPTRDDMAGKVRSAAEANGRKFYVMYDVTGWASMQSEIKTDWTTKMSAHTASAAYAHQNGKPVVCIWGFGYDDANHTWDAAACLDVVTWFKSQGCYVIGGVPREWRDIGASRPGFADVFHAFDMLSPWMVGAIGTAADSDWMYTNLNVPDVADCAAHGIDYQPCVLPGDVSARQRTHGDFMWRQFYNMIRAGAQGLYISMFDEFNEGNQIAKTAATPADAPAGFLTLDEDGTACSPDYYLRLTGDGGRMLKGEIALTSVRPTSPTPGTTPSGDRAAGRPTSQSSQTQGYGSANAVDGNPESYWESANNAFPQWVQVDLGSAVAVTRVELTLPSSWAARTQTLSIVDGSSGVVLAPASGHRFDPASANTVTVSLPGTAVRDLRVVLTANTGWAAGQLSGLRVYA